MSTSFQDDSTFATPLTREELLELERAPRSTKQVCMDYLICAGPILAGALALLEYLYVPNLPGNESTSVYVIFIAGLMILLGAVLASSFKSRRAFQFLRYKAPFYTFVFFILTGYDYLTLKTGILMLPYFPWVDQVLGAVVEDWLYLLECAGNSLILLFTGYFSGAGAGLATGIACGYNKRINYWIAPFMKLLGAIPAMTWLPVVMVLAASLFKGSVFIIALGVWYSVTIASLTGITNIDKSYFEAARTLGARGAQLVFRVAIPFALPNIFQGLTQGMSSACTALLILDAVYRDRRQWGTYGYDMPNLKNYMKTNKSGNWIIDGSGTATPITAAPIMSDTQLNVLWSGVIDGKAAQCLTHSLEAALRRSQPETPGASVWAWNCRKSTLGSRRKGWGKLRQIQPVLC